MPPITETEHPAPQAGLRASDAILLHRAQILLAGTRGMSAPQIAESLGRNKQNVLTEINTFKARGWQR